MSVRGPVSDHRARAVVAVLGSAALFGTTGTVLVGAPDSADAVSVGTLRLLVGAATLAVIARWRHRRGATLPRPGSTAIGAAGVAIFQLGYFLAVERTGVAVGTVVTIGSGPLIGGALHALGARQWPSPRWLAGTATGVAGVVALGLAGRDVAVDPVGIALAIAAGAGWATFATVGRHEIDRGVESTLALAAVFAAGALILSPLLVDRPLGWVTTAPGATAVLYLGVVTVGVAYWLYGLALRSLTAPVVITLTLLEPITAAVLGRVVVGEEVTLTGWVGIAAVLGGLVLAAPRAADQV